MNKNIKKDEKIQKADGKEFEWTIAAGILRIRAYQIHINELYKKGHFKIPIHLAFGHESIAVAADHVVTESDTMILTHRNIHYNFARLDSFKKGLDEYLLLESGLARSKLGSMNLSNPDRNIVYSSSILGNNFPVACGYAMGNVVRNCLGMVSVVCGDGAIEEGAFYESMLFAKSNRLPLLVIVENNQWSLATSITERRFNFELTQFAKFLDIGYERLSGNDPYIYIDRLTSCKSEVLRDRTPFIVEVDVTTLGSWYKNEEGFPEGKFVNYHAGPAHGIDNSDYPMISASKDDPLFVLKKYFSQERMMEECVQLAASISSE